VTIRHHVAAACGHHPDNSVQQLCALIQPPHASNRSNVRRYLVIGEDATELLGDGHPVSHLATVESDHEGIVDEALGIGLGILSIPRVEDRAVQFVEISGPTGVGHADDGNRRSETMMGGAASR
jgi:hypothetical protein